MKALFDQVSARSSKLTTHTYSTSFSIGIRLLNKRLRHPIYSVYGFVRFADEIVDSFHDYDKQKLFDQFRKDTYSAIEDRISLNPILNSFQATVHKYGIDRELIDCFLASMESDLQKKAFEKEEYDKYILGSAEVVGLMCLRIFCEGDMMQYNELKYYAMRLGSAFQKINFLRDLKNDYEELGRSYFPELQVNRFDDESKRLIEEDIRKDFEDGYQGIKKLPKKARFGVYMAYAYYIALFNKIKNTPSRKILDARIRIPNNQKYTLLVSSYLRHSFNLL